MQINLILSGIIQNNILDDYPLLGLSAIALIIAIFIISIVLWKRLKNYPGNIWHKKEEMYRNAIAVAGAVPYYQNYKTDTYDFVHEDIEQLLGFQSHEFTPEVWESCIQETLLLGNLKGLSIADAVQKSRGQEGISWRADYHVLTRNNQEKWVSNAAVQVRDDKGNVIGSLGILQDITERKRLEFQLYQTQKYEALGQLSGGVAHNINNLLTGIVGNLALAQQKCNPEISGFLDNVSQAANRAAEMVRELQVFSRDIPNKIVDLDLNKIIDEVYGLINNTFKKYIHIEKQLQNPLPMIHADATQIYSVVMNLCINAKDAIENINYEQYPERQNDSFFILLTTKVIDSQDEAIKSKSIQHAEQYICFSIQDNGTGIEPEIQERIFEPFFTTKNTVGTGLGLSSVYGIVEQHQGYVTFETTPGEGTTFFVYLPVTNVQQKTI